MESWSEITSKNGLRLGLPLRFEKEEDVAHWDNSPLPASGWI